MIPYLYTLSNDSTSFIEKYQAYTSSYLKLPKAKDKNKKREKDYLIHVN